MNPEIENEITRIDFDLGQSIIASPIFNLLSEEDRNRLDEGLICGVEEFMLINQAYLEQSHGLYKPV